MEIVDFTVVQYANRYPKKSNTIEKTTASEKVQNQLPKEPKSN